MSAESSGGLRPIERVVAPVRGQLIEMLRNAILGGEWDPGERLVERELCEKTAASRTSVREALRQLEAEGLVASLPSRGPVVAVISVAEARDIYELRGILEGLSTKRFAQRATDDQLARLQAAFAHLETAAADGQPRAVMQAKDRFYDVVLEGSGNSAVSWTLKALHVRISLLRAATLGAPGRVDQSVAELRAIVEAITKRDARGAERASRAHVRTAAAVAIRQLRGGEAS